MTPAPSPRESLSTGARSSGTEGSHRSDRVMSVPLVRLFYPEPDPTEEFPSEIVDVDGYVLTRDHAVTLAATVQSAGGLDMLDSVWSSLRKRGVGHRRMLLLDDRGRTVSVMTVRPKAPDRLVDLLRTLLIVPMRAHGGFLEVHFLATEDEVEALEQTIETGREPGTVPTEVALPEAKETGVLTAEDWAFMGLLCSVGAFNGPDGPEPELLADLLGVDPVSFADQARAVERNMGSLVTELFAPESSGTGPGGIMA